MCKVCDLDGMTAPHPHHFCHFQIQKMNVELSVCSADWDNPKPLLTYAMSFSFGSMISFTVIAKYLIIIAASDSRK